MQRPLPHHISQEIWDLAAHHLKILRHKFPDYKYKIYETAGQEPTGDFASVTIHIGPTTIFWASFTSSFLEITTLRSDERIYYADPEFTDDILSDKLKEMVL